MKCALLAIDMQEHFRELAEDILPALTAVLDCARQHGVPVIYTQHGHLDPEVDEQHSVLVAWWGAAGSIKLGSPAWQLLSELRRQPNDHVITSKRTYDAFQGTELEGLLREQGIDTLIVSGVMTHLCCETTARSAFTRNLNVLFLKDGTATSSPAHHKASLLNLADGFATVLSCAELQELLAGSQAGAAAHQLAGGRQRKW